MTYKIGDLSYSLSLIFNDINIFDWGGKVIIVTQESVGSLQNYICHDKNAVSVIS